MSYPQFGYHRRPIGRSQIHSPRTPSVQTAVTSESTPCCDNQSQVCVQSTNYSQNRSLETPQNLQMPRYSIGPPPSTVPTNNPSLPLVLHPVPPSLSTMYPNHTPTPSIFAGTDPYSSKPVDSSSFYSPLSGQYMFKDNLTDHQSWHTGVQNPYYHYDPSFTPYGYSNFEFGGGSLMRRKNATRETTGTLKAWLNEHRKNPYPTKGEKIMLAIITKMTLTQVSTWFANARRRLKKENKMTWEPRSRATDGENLDDSDVDEDENYEKLDSELNDPVKPENTERSEIVDEIEDESKANGNSSQNEMDDKIELNTEIGNSIPKICSLVSKIDSVCENKESTPDRRKDLNKPKIWSLADTATNDNDHSSLGSSRRLQMRVPSCSSYIHPYHQQPNQQALLPTPFYNHFSRPSTFIGNDTPPQTPPSAYSYSGFVKDSLKEQSVPSTLEMEGQNHQSSRAHE